jgi:hypothetical protein
VASDAYPGLRARPGWAAAEAALKEAGLIYSSSGPDEAHVSDDVLFSLRYRDDDHIARELGEPGPLHQAAPYPARAAEAGPDTLGVSNQGRADSHPPARPAEPGPGPVPEPGSINVTIGPANCNIPETLAAGRTGRRSCRCIDGGTAGVLPPWQGQKLISTVPIGATDISRRRTDKVVTFPLTLS